MANQAHKWGIAWCSCSHHAGRIRLSSPGAIQTCEIPIAEGAGSGMEYGYGRSATETLRSGCAIARMG
ncbi:hypothetical protein ACFLXE_07065 [Chloroflexota bacterium]